MTTAEADRVERGGRVELLLTPAEIREMEIPPVGGRFSATFPLSPNTQISGIFEVADMFEQLGKVRVSLKPVLQPGEIRFWSGAEKKVGLDTLDDIYMAALTAKGITEEERQAVAGRIGKMLSDEAAKRGGGCGECFEGCEKCSPKR